MKFFKPLERAERDPAEQVATPYYANGLGHGASRSWLRKGESS